MNRIEDRLRDAFGAAADTVRPESVARLPDQLRVTRPKRLTPLAAAAAVAVVVIGASIIAPLVLAGGHHASPSSTRTGAPGSVQRPPGPLPCISAGIASPGGCGAPSPGASKAVVTVPMVTGMPVNQALATLQAVGLRIVVTPGANTAVPQGTVIAQNPAAGVEARAGASVTLTINRSRVSSSAAYSLAPAPTRLATVSVYAVTVPYPPG
ncbi:MAG: PASTA domain-containing protein [Streptosporangiaceae bacterium]